MGLKDIGRSLPPGFRFYPSDEELVCHYLQKKIANEQVCKGTLVEIDLHICEPWQLPGRLKRIHPPPSPCCLFFRFKFPSFPFHFLSMHVFGSLFPFPLSFFPLL
ncbi:hypothetical protein Ancab_022454 [Ancistrocladus abbreviatus]